MFRNIYHGLSLINKRILTLYIIIVLKIYMKILYLRDEQRYLKTKIIIY